MLILAFFAAILITVFSATLANLFNSELWWDVAEWGSVVAVFIGFAVTAMLIYMFI